MIAANEMKGILAGERHSGEILASKIGILVQQRRRDVDALLATSEFQEGARGFVPQATRTAVFDHRAKLRPGAKPWDRSRAIFVCGRPVRNGSGPGERARPEEGKGSRATRARKCSN